ncbi:MAG: transposase [Bacteroidales bacterium]|nr:transposase [Bacteroidales bacterium]
MDKLRKSPRQFEMSFKLAVLQDYYESGNSKLSICKKHQIALSAFLRWQSSFENKAISLPDDLNELESKIYMAHQKRKIQESEDSPVLSESERLRNENERLRKALAYSELRNEGLSEIIKISSEKYGIDLLKKAGAKQ